jgi:hypothetical protein
MSNGSRCPIGCEAAIIDIENIAREKTMPFCPNCKVEYRSEITLCPDCQVNLVESLPQPTADEIEAANLYRLDALAVLADFNNISEAEMIQELLAGNQIETTLRGQGDQYSVFIGSVKPVTLLVEKHNLESAREIYEAYFAGQNTQELESAAEEKE